MNLENSSNTQPWLINHGDFNKVFIGGDSAGGNIVHNIAMRAGSDALHWREKSPLPYIPTHTFTGQI